MQGIVNDDPLLRDDAEALRLQADQYRHAYEYEKAIEIYSQTLSMDGLPFETRYELLDGRSECYEYLIEEQGWVQLKGKSHETQVFSVPVGQKV
jgi:hypothetical protein